MADCFIQILVPADRESELRKLIEQMHAVEPWQDPSDNRSLFSIQVPAERVEAVLDPIQSRFLSTKGFRVVVVPVEARLPRQEEPGQKSPGDDSASEEPPRDAMRTSREELYADLSGPPLFPLRQEELKEGPATENHRLPPHLAQPAKIR